MNSQTKKTFPKVRAIRALMRESLAVFAIDPHVHSFFSVDAADDPRDLIAAAKKRGLDGIVITDHDACRAHAYCVEYGLARTDGKPVDGFLVVPGMEVSSADGHILCIGASIPPMIGVPADIVCAAIRDAGGEPVPAHPFDHWRSGLGAGRLRELSLHAIEVFNAAVSSRKFNVSAGNFARSNGLAGTAGSDAHHASAVGVSRTHFDTSELSVEAVVNAIRSGSIRPEGHYLSKTEALKKHLGNLLRPKRIPA
jgi:predicted metal-dependent phosphoesterase TrpH